MNNNVVPKRTKTITLRYILGWIFGIVFVLLGFVASFDSNLFAGIFAFAIAVVILPPVSKVIEEKYDLVFSGGVKSVLVVVMLFGFGYFFKTSPAIPSPVENTSQVVQEKITTPKEVSAQKPIQNSEKSTQNTVPISAPATKTYQQVFTFSGNGAKKSEPFTITGQRFKIKYDCQGDLCQAFLYPLKSKFPEIIMNTTGSTKDETIIYGSGDYYIQANIMGSYSMTVEDYR
jgi:hypothetical protein